MPNEREKLSLPASVPDEARQILNFFADCFNQRVASLNEDKEKLAGLMARTYDSDDPSLTEPISFETGRIAGREKELLNWHSALKLAAEDLGGELKPVDPPVNR